MTSIKRVVALVAAYQAAEFIRRTLDSLVSQTLYNLDVIISVDLCEDETYAICQEYCANYPNFRVTRQDKRLGWVGNCNYLLEQAHGDYVMFASHDDVFKAEYLEKLCRVMDERSDVVMCYSDVLLTNMDGEKEHWEYREMDGLKNRVHRGLKMLNRSGLWWVPYRGIFRLNQARKINGLKLHGAGEFSADLPWLFHMSLRGEFVRVSETLCYKFYIKGSLSRSWEFSTNQWHEVTLACMRELWSSDLTLKEKLHITSRFQNGPSLTAKLLLRHIRPRRECC